MSAIVSLIFYVATVFGSDDDGRGNAPVSRDVFGFLLITGVLYVYFLSLAFMVKRLAKWLLVNMGGPHDIGRDEVYCSW